MFETLQYLGAGTAAVVDTVLLLAILERPNRRIVANWMVLLVVGVWLWHAGGFVQTLLSQPAGVRTNWDGW